METAPGVSYLRAQTPSLLHVLLRIKNTFTFFFSPKLHLSFSQLFGQLLAFMWQASWHYFVEELFFPPQFVDVLIWLFFELSIALFKRPTGGCVCSLGDRSFDKCHSLIQHLFILIPLAFPTWVPSQGYKKRIEDDAAVDNEPCWSVDPQKWLESLKQLTNRPDV